MVCVFWEHCWLSSGIKEISSEKVKRLGDRRATYIITSAPQPALRGSKLQASQGSSKQPVKRTRAESPSQTRSLGPMGWPPGPGAMVVVPRRQLWICRDRVQVYHLCSSSNQERFPQSQRSPPFQVPQRPLGILFPPQEASRPCFHSRTPFPCLGQPAIPVRPFSGSWREGLQEVKGREHQACTWHLGCHTLGCPWPLASCILHPRGRLHSLQGSNPERPGGPQRHPFHSPAQV